jgi:hypothetical protein
VRALPLLAFFLVAPAFGADIVAEEWLRADGQPVTCGGAGRGRRARELPEIDAPIVDRTYVSALQAGLFSSSIERDAAGVDWLSLAIKMQLVSCVDGKNVAVWVIETPDPKDAAEIYVPTSLFDGILQNIPLEPHVIVPMGDNAPAPYTVHVARFRARLLDLLTSSERKKYRAGGVASVPLELRYLYQSAYSSVRPAFPLRSPYSENPGVFPARFSLILGVQIGQVRAAQMRPTQFSR